MPEGVILNKVLKSHYFYCTCPTCGHKNPVRSDFAYRIPGFVLGHRCRACLSHPEGMPVTELVLGEEQMKVWEDLVHTEPPELWRK